MRKKQIDDIIHSFFRHLEKQTLRIKKKATIEAVHSFRVEIKKLSCFLRIIFFNSSKQEKEKIPHRLKKMYSTLGKIRDAQLLMARLETSFPGIKISYPRAIGRSNGHAKVNILSQKNLTEIERKIKKKILDKTAVDTLKDFSSAKSQSILAILRTGKYADKNLHAIRKELKDIIYTMKFFRAGTTALSRKGSWNKNDLKKAETIANNLGLFNDACNTLSYLYTTALKKTVLKNLKVLEQAQKKWIDEKRVLIKQFRENIPNLRKLCTQLTSKND